MTMNDIQYQDVDNEPPLLCFHPFNATACDHLWGSTFVSARCGETHCERRRLFNTAARARVRQNGKRDFIYLDDAEPLGGLEHPSKLDGRPGSPEKVDALKAVGCARTGPGDFEDPVYVHVNRSRSGVAPVQRWMSGTVRGCGGGSH